MRTKKGLTAAGILFLSISGHYLAYGILRGMSEGKQVSAWSLALTIITAVLGLAGIAGALFAVPPNLSWRRVIRPLLWLGVFYLLLQLILSVLAGGAGWLISSISGASGAGIKTAADIICRVLQVPVRVFAMLFLVNILTGRDFEFGLLFVKAAVACAVYSILLWLVNQAGTGSVMLAVRVCTDSALTCALWMYVYREYGRGETGYEEEI